jgi:ATP-dependent protease ClpP protease subunit
LIHVIGEITAETFSNYMRQVEKVGAGWTPETVLISSPGGDIGYTLAMLDEIDESKRGTRATGFCQSAAAVLATAGEGRRICTADTLFRFMPPMKEKVWVVVEGAPTEVEKVPDYAYYIHSLLVARLASRLKTPVADISLWFDGEFISSTRAKELGLIDEIIFTEAPSGDPNRLQGSEGGSIGWASDRY